MRGILRGRIRAEDGVLMNLHHRVGERRRGAGVADAPAGHRERLRKAVQEDAALAHAGQRRDADVLRAVVGQLAVDFIGEHDEIVLDAEPRRSFPAPRGVCVAPVGLHGKLSISTFDARCDFRLQRFGGEPEVVFRACRHRDGDAVGHRRRSARS